MTINESKKWRDGRDLWFEYIRINGYSFTPTESGLSNLSKALDLNKKYISERINFYLES